MVKKILISILIVLTMFSLLFLSCKDSTSTEVSDEIQTGEESVPQESEKIDDTGEESVEAETDDTDGKEESEGGQDIAEAAEEEIEEGGLAKEGEVTFMTEDNIELNGNIFGSGNKWVILSHMFPTDQTSWFEFAEILKEDGYIILTYDFRGYGKSGGSKDVSKLDIDLAAALAYIKQYDPELIYLMGASMGGTASLVLASEERIDGVISFSSPDEFEGISAISVIGDIVAGKLFIASQGDEDAARSATEMYEKSMEPKQLEILEGDSHGTFIFEEEPENAEKLKEIVLFFLY
ncbi:MAG: alpha/beta fold hydrolase [Actinobacteria bacterium]|nr:alpha/beta fold hydrolase [Actinomycetota bacterium]